MELQKKERERQQINFYLDKGAEKLIELRFKNLEDGQQRIDRLNQ